MGNSSFVYKDVEDTSKMSPEQFRKYSMMMELVEDLEKLVSTDEDYEKVRDEIFCDLVNSFVLN
jgi:hypothetical protein